MESAQTPRDSLQTALLSWGKEKMLCEHHQTQQAWKNYQALAGLQLCEEFINTGVQPWDLSRPIGSLEWKSIATVRDSCTFSRELPYFQRQGDELTTLQIIPSLRWSQGQHLPNSKRTGKPTGASGGALISRQGSHHPISNAVWSKPPTWAERRLGLFTQMWTAEGKVHTLQVTATRGSVAWGQQVVLKKARFSMKAKTADLKTLKFGGGVFFSWWLVFLATVQNYYTGLVVTLYWFDKKLMRIQKGLGTASTLTCIVKGTEDF